MSQFLVSTAFSTSIHRAARDSAVVACIALQHGVDGNGVTSGPLGTLLDLLAKTQG